MTSNQMTTDGRDRRMRQSTGTKVNGVFLVLSSMFITSIVLGTLILVVLLLNGSLGNQPLTESSSQELAFRQKPPLEEVRTDVTLEAGESGPEINTLPLSALQALPSATRSPLLPKQIMAASTGSRAAWTPTPLPTETPLPSPTPMPTFVADLSSSAILQPFGLVPDQKWIDVNLTSQTLVAYEGMRPVFDSLVSSGTANHPTVKGQFRIWLRFQSQTMDGRRLGYDYYLQNVPYVQYFFQDYALHGTYWHNNFGTPMSHGCVNLPTSAAEWLFNWAAHGTLVNIHS